MVALGVLGVLESLLAIDLAVADSDAVLAALGESRRVRARLDGFDVAAARRLDELARQCPSMFPERAVAEATRVSITQATKGFERAKTLDIVPELGAVLAVGDTTGAHVDVVTRALGDLEPHQRQQLAERGEMLAAAAAMLPRDEFARTVRRHVHQLCADGGLSRLERQKRATRLRTWTDHQTGMWCLHGEYDPETGLQLDRQLQTMLDRLFHNPTPETCPSDPTAKQHYLRALALAALCNGGGSKVRTELTILIDAKTLLDGEHDDTHCDCGLDIDLPIETIRRMACCADIVAPVITAANGINMHLGRQQRQPSRAQRRALRATYQYCAIPGCTIAFDACQIHHLRWWRHLGRTDIENLIPLCHRHHHNVHEDHWSLHLDNHRNLTITKPDRTTLTTGPPKRGAG